MQLQGLRVLELPQTWIIARDAFKLNGLLPRQCVVEPAQELGLECPPIGIRFEERPQ